MDYTRTNALFKIKKVLRYIQLYGVRRTLIKVKGQYHMQRDYTTLPQKDKTGAHSGHVGLLGCGNYAFSNIAYYLRKNYGKVIRATMDKNINRAASLCDEYQCAYYTDNAQEIIDDKAIDTVYIASNHATHAEYAILALEKGKHVHIEKPHCVSEDQLKRLIQAAENSSGKICSVGFNRPNSRIGKLIREKLGDETGASMLNWFVAGHELDPDHWYFKEEEGGRVLGNLCHWTDFTYTMIDADKRYPITITPTRSEKSDCDIAVSYIFGDGSIAVITFSAKGHTFEGVREKFAAHRGNVLVSMDDFKDLRIEIVDKKLKPFQLHRDHGHEISICSSYERAKKSENRGLSNSYIWETGQLFLKTKEALETNKTITINGFEDYANTESTQERVALAD